MLTIAPAATQDATPWVLIGIVVGIYILIRSHVTTRVRQEAVAKAIATKQILDEDAVLALMVLGFNRKAAVGALTESQWRGNSTEERVRNALLTTPNFAGAPGRQWECECGVINPWNVPFCQRCSKKAPAATP